jgi:hypothetical protein
VSGLIEWLRAQIDQDEWWAREASRSPFDEWTPTGEHWHWAVSETDEPLVPDPVSEAYLGEGAEDCRVGLRSIEEYPQPYSARPLCHVMFGAEEVETAVGGHIIRHDPARVLRRVAADRAILDALAIVIDGERHVFVCDGACECGPGRDRSACRIVRLLALSYSHLPGYRTEWAL